MFDLPCFRQNRTKELLLWPLDTVTQARINSFSKYNKTRLYAGKYLISKLELHSFILYVQILAQSGRFMTDNLTKSMEKSQDIQEKSQDALINHRKKSQDIYKRFICHFKYQFI